MSNHRFGTKIKIRFGTLGIEFEGLSAQHELYLFFVTQHLISYPIQNANKYVTTPIPGLQAMALATRTVDLGAPFVRPNQKITEFLALGDSWTAGVGSNGRPERVGGLAERGWSAYPFQMLRDEAMWEYINGDSTFPRLNFLAHTGDKVKQLVDKQLTVQGEWDHRNWDEARGMPFGHPQIAVMTVGGNDAHFSK